MKLGGREHRSIICVNRFLNQKKRNGMLSAQEVDSSKSDEAERMPVFIFGHKINSKQREHSV